MIHPFNCTEHRSDPSLLSLKKLSVYRGEKSILREVDWQINPGEHWVILGANGSGKTSLLSALCGYLMPSSGEIKVLGEHYGESDWRALRTKIGLVSSSVRQQIKEDAIGIKIVVSGRYAVINFYGRILKQDRVLALRLMRHLRISHLAESEWRFLSQGERQKILIARALMATPKLLILDEPCAGLDPSARIHFLQFLNRLGRKKQGVPLVLVTHHVEEIVSCFSHILLLKKGRVVAAGAKERILTEKNFQNIFGKTIQLTINGTQFGTSHKL